SIPRHPAHLRFWVSYADPNCNPRVGVPPESVWVTLSTIAGNAVANDLTLNGKTFADDSTNADGRTWITIPSLSGCGTLSANLRVSGVSEGALHTLVRTTDTDADGRVTYADTISYCDINYSGAVDSGDRAEVLNHRTDWHRNALHGTLVRRTNLSYAE